MIDIDVDKMSDDELLKLLQDRSNPLSKARMRFYHHCASIEQAEAQQRPPSIMEIRRMEFKATIDIINTCMEERDDTA
jgi:hypothetical protein